MKADLSINTVTTEGRTIRMPPGWRADVIDYRDGVGKERYALGGVHQPSRNGWIPNTDGGVLGDDFSIEGDVKSPEDLAIEIAASVMAVTLHEVIEWVLLDGEPLAQAHPAGGTNWQWGQDRCRVMILDYIANYPKQPTSSTPPS